MIEFSLVTLNTFGVPMYVAWSRLARTPAVLHRLAPTVLCLQEIQQNAYVPLMQRNLPSYPYHAFAPHWWAPKGGLLTLSRVALQDITFMPFPNRGRLLSVGYADWALHKGVMAARLRIDGHAVVVLNTHLQANYSGNWLPGNAFAGIQHDQVHFLADQVQAQPAGTLVVVCGDFNFPRGTQLYEELIGLGGLTDPLADDPRPTYRPFPLVPSRWAMALDFILYRAEAAGQGACTSVSADILPLEDSAARSAIGRFLTDHCALSLRVTWEDSAGI